MKTNTKQVIAFFLGITLLAVVIFYSDFRISARTMSQAANINLALSIVNVILRIFAAYFCGSIAKELYRNSFSWAAIALFLPHLTLIAISFLNKKEIEQLTQKEEYDLAPIQQMEMSIGDSELSQDEKEKAKKFIEYGIKNNERLVINKITREITRLDEKEWNSLVSKNEHKDWQTINF